MSSRLWTGAFPTGLGLAAIVDRAGIIGGDLDIQSQIGSSTRLTFTIPTQPGNVGCNETV